MKFRILSSFEDNWEILNRLNDSSFEPSPFLTSNYLCTWDNCFSAMKDKLIVLGEGGGKKRAAGVFYLREEPSTYFLLGGKSLSDRLGFLIEDGYEQEFLEGFFDFIRGEESLRGSHFVINNVNGETPQAGILSEVASKSEVLRLTKVDSSPYIELPPSYDDYLSNLSGKSRHELRRKMRRADENFNGIHIEVFDGTDLSKLPTAMDEFVRLHRASNAGKLNFWKGQRREFFDEIAREFGKAGWLKILFLLSGSRGERVAALMIFDYRGDFLLYNSGFNPAYGKSSPGLVLIAKAIELAIGEGKKKFDFLRGEERYKYDLGSKDRPVYRVEFGV